ncbi:hypothetical protein EJ08DRAFT_646082 [Tothia fuscella]|uniref:Uncharacterized protein n=1 Tax=Tothia fuscella TaxID=1048955 RepID=A0A9P4U3R0_9PEZI|nr:hypothetical protein EJ08DRAFT_646082 [Tothia fuscella]
MSTSNNARNTSGSPSSNQSQTARNGNGNDDQSGEASNTTYDEDTLRNIVTSTVQQATTNAERCDHENDAAFHLFSAAICMFGARNIAAVRELTAFAVDTFTHATLQRASSECQQVLDAVSLTLGGNLSDSTVAGLKVEGGKAAARAWRLLDGSLLN